MLDNSFRYAHSRFAFAYLCKIRVDNFWIIYIKRYQIEFTNVLNVSDYFLVESQQLENIVERAIFKID